MEVCFIVFVFCFGLVGGLPEGFWGWVYEAFIFFFRGHFLDATGLGRMVEGLGVLIVVPYVYRVAHVF